MNIITLEMRKSIACFVILFILTTCFIIVYFEDTVNLNQFVNRNNKTTVTFNQLSLRKNRSVWISSEKGLPKPLLGSANELTATAVPLRKLEGCTLPGKT